MARVRSREAFKQRQTGYKLAFGSPAGMEVLRDLMLFCRAHQSCFHQDPRVHAVLEGRREVYLRIRNHLNLTEEQAFAVFGGVDLKPDELETDDA